jgi:hypothetical protein
MRARRSKVATAPSRARSSTVTRCPSRPIAGIRGRARRAALSPMSRGEPAGWCNVEPRTATRISAACPGGSERRTEPTQHLGRAVLVHPRRVPSPRRQPCGCPRRRELRTRAWSPCARGISDDASSRHSSRCLRSPRHPWSSTSQAASALSTSLPTRGVPGNEANFPLYASSKAALNMLTHSVRRRLPANEDQLSRSGSTATDFNQHRVQMSCHLNDKPWKRRAACRAALRLAEVLSCRYSTDRLAGHPDR